MSYLPNNLKDVVETRILELRAEGFSWTKISKLINQEFSTNFTKEGIRSIYRRSVSKTFPQESLKLELNTQKLEGIISSLRKENQLLRLKLLTQEEILSVLADEAFLNREPIKLQKPKLSTSTLKPKRDILLLLSDVQAGLLATKAKTLINNYNEKVIKKRAERYLEATLKTLEDFSKGHELSKVIVVFLGDMVEGHDIFSGQVYALEKQAIEQTFFLTECFESLLIELFKGIREFSVAPLSIFAVSGNHGQLGGRKTQGVLGLNFDYGFYLFLKKVLSLQVKEISFTIAEGPSLYFKSMDSTFLTIHGDEVRGWAGFPFYGFGRLDAQAIRYSELLHDYLLAAHWHTPTELTVGRGGIIVNGCWCGATDLSAKNKLPSFPSQFILVNSKKYGLTHRIQIALDEFEPPEVKVYEA